ncbi:stage VI sporulation protein D [Alkalicoccobacillus plakortidis]|uniref:Stage VI sporulation protein D n=1 Tax=Alkalicoccobacillus plakortidis TaxID=444060 RepID=A0ABT0XJ10_9BACI|nr:stage VI sporulation protein D [Alkalicoccobacillus plakortidis]MCM2675194.1 stage VI sporulation protein D [Alkalicoccobacillus plakortidis]
MAQEHPSKLTLTVEESVWLNKGQEIEEILGMSLSPEIAIKEEGNQVSIVGGLRLVGEYLLADSNQDQDSEQNEDDGYREQASFRSIEEVRISENGRGDLKHFFPIDVTIPLDRIQNLQDIYVEVESFDYDVPDKSCIQLTADISISGMTGADELSSQEDQPEDVQDEPNRIEEDEQVVDTSFSYEAYQLPTPTSTVASDDSVERVEVQVEPPSEVTEQASYSDLQRITLAPQQSEPNIERQQTEEVEIDENEDQPQEVKAEREENALYLTGMMAKSDEQFTRLKMCIIQEDESLDTIADRYDVTTSQLIRTNRLEADQIEAGQILYIPVQS